MIRPYLIGFAGVAGSGKTTLAQHLEKRWGYNRTSFAAPLKEALQGLFMLSKEQLTDFDAKEAIDPRWGYSPRTLMQTFGTNFIREMIDEDFWVKRMGYLIEEQHQYSKIVIDDVRFPNEANLIRVAGGKIIHVIRDDNPYQTSNPNHASEQILDILTGDFTVTNNEGQLARVQINLNNILQEIHDG